MHILIISQYFHPENFRINDLGQALVERGHSVTVLTGLPNYPAGKFMAGYGYQGPWSEFLGRISVRRVPLVPRGRGGGWRLTVNYFSFVLSASWAVLFRLRKSESFDAIFVFEPSPITIGLVSALARWKFRVPVLFWILDLWPKTLQAVEVVRSPRVLSLLDGLVKWIYRRCDLLLIQSEAFRSELERQEVSEEQIRYFPNWGEAQYEAWQDIPDDHRPEVVAAGFKIMFAGNIGAAQDFPTIIEAADRLREAEIEWVIVGDGRAAGEAKALVAEKNLGHKVIFLGQHPNEAMPGLFRTADALLLSLRDDPIFALTVPGKLQSYLTARRPVIGMINGEGARIIEEAGAGVTCPAGSADGLVDCVERLMALSPEARNEMGARGLAYYQDNFSRRRLLDKLESWFLEASGSHLRNRKTI